MFNPEADSDSCSSLSIASDLLLDDDDDEEYWGKELENESPTNKSSADYTFCKFKFQEIIPTSDIKPKPRSGHRIVHYKGRIFSFGGYNPSIDQHDPDMAEDEVWAESRPLFKELWELNLSTRVWTRCCMRGEVPEQLASHTAVTHPAHPGTMLIYGGTGAPFGLTTSNTVVACSLDTQTFSQLEVDETDFGAGWPMPLYGQAVVADPGRLITVGGTSGFTYFMDVHRLDLSGDGPPHWTCLYQPSGAGGEPEPRYRHELCLWEDQLIVLGGGTSFSADTFQSLPTFSLASHSWSRTPTRPDPGCVRIDLSEEGWPDRRRCHSAVQRGENVWIFGGYDGEEIFGDIWHLHLPSMQWRRLELQLPLPVYFHAMTLSQEGRMVMFGGVDDIEANTRTSQVFSCWLQIPSLKVLAWEAVCHRRGAHLGSLPASLLVEEGVPRDCVDMLGQSQSELSDRQWSEAECG